MVLEVIDLRQLAENEEDRMKDIHNRMKPNTSRMATAGKLRCSLRSVESCAAVPPHLTFADTLQFLEAVSYTHLTLPTKRIV